MKQLADWIERINEWLGHITGWLMFFLVLLVTADVVSRYLFNTGAVVIQETEWWLFSVIFLMGAGYTLLHEGHVRVDLVYSLLSNKGQDIIDLIGAFIFLFPMCLLLILTSRNFIESSWSLREGSPDPGGLPAYYVLKAFIPLGFLFLMLQGLVMVYRIVKRMRQGDYPEGRAKLS